MIDGELWLTYLATVLLLMSTPGPSHLLMLSNSLSTGFPRSMATACGDLSANLLQMLAAALGLAALIHSSSTAFMLIKWLGVAYLVFLGIRLWQQTPKIISNGPNYRTIWSLYWQGFVTSAANPKAVVFFASLFPLFIDLSRPVAMQFVQLSATYLVVDLSFLTLYGMGANVLKKYAKTRGQVILQRLSGILLIFAAIALGIKGVEVENTSRIFSPTD